MVTVERQEEKRAKVVGACVIDYGKVPTVGPRSKESRNNK